MNCSMPGVPVLHYRRPLNSIPSTVSCLLGHERARQMTGPDGGERSRYIFRQPLPQSLCYWSFSSVARSCPSLCDTMGCSTPGLPVHHQLPELVQTHVHRVCDAIQPSHPLSHPLFLLSSIFPSIRVLSNESVLCIRWPNYWSFSFSISPSNENSGLVCFRID